MSTTARPKTTMLGGWGCYDNELQVKAWMLNQYAKLGMPGNIVN